MAEVYEQSIRASMSLRRRICAVAYASWLFVEGFSAVFRQLSSAPMIVPQVETPFMYFVGSGLLFVLLHSYVGGRFGQYGVRLITFVHQVSLTALSLMFFVGSPSEGKSWYGFRAAVLCACAIGETEACILELGALWSKTDVEEGFDPTRV